MSRRLSVCSLLNPVVEPQQPSATALWDIQPQLAALLAFSQSIDPVLVPLDIWEALSRVSAHLLSSTGTLTPLPLRSSPIPSQSPPPMLLPLVPALSSITEVRHNVLLNRVTVLSSLYIYGPGALVEYPQTVDKQLGPVGHLFQLDPLNWQLPVSGFAYSLGTPSGRTLKGTAVYCHLLVDKNNKRIPCSERHYTCVYDIEYLTASRNLHSCRPGF